MKNVGKVLALIAVGMLTVIAVQQIIRRVYQRMGRKRFIEIPAPGAEAEFDEARSV